MHSYYSRCFFFSLLHLQPTRVLKMHSTYMFNACRHTHKWKAINTRSNHRFHDGENVRTKKIEPFVAVCVLLSLLPRRLLCAYVLHLASLWFPFGLWKHITLKRIFVDGETSRQNNTTPKKCVASIRMSHQNACVDQIICHCGCKLYLY